MNDMIGEMDCLACIPHLPLAYRIPLVPKACMIGPDELMILLCEQVRSQIPWMTWMVHLLMVCPWYRGENVLSKIQVREVRHDPFVQAKSRRRIENWNDLLTSYR